MPQIIGCVLTLWLSGQYYFLHRNMETTRSRWFSFKRERKKMESRKAWTWERCSRPTLRISLFLWWICFILVFEEHCRSNADKIQVRLLSLTAFQVLLNVFLCSRSEILFGVAWGGGGLNFKVEEMREERAIEYDLWKEIVIIIFFYVAPSHFMFLSLSPLSLPFLPNDLWGTCLRWLYST